jgi:hypothetical protein
MSLTGETFSGRYLAEHCNRTVEEAWDATHTSIKAAAERQRPPVQSLNASIRVVHGDEVLASNTESDNGMFTEFREWIDRRYH